MPDASAERRPAICTYSDGASQGNPGPAGAGVVVRAGRDILERLSEPLGIRTNNQAEYLALILALEAAGRHCPSEVSCFLDSELVVKQINGRYKVRDADLRLLHARALELAGALGHVSFSHIPRERNAEADRLAGQAIRRQRLALRKARTSSSRRPD